MKHTRQTSWSLSSTTEPQRESQWFKLLVIVWSIGFAVTLSVSQVMADKSNSLQGVKWSRNLRSHFSFFVHFTDFLYFTWLPWPLKTSSQFKPQIFSVRDSASIVVIVVSFFLTDREETMTEANRVKLIQRQKMMLESKRQRRPQVVSTVSR
jgi:hypothetical protein